MSTPVNKRLLAATRRRLESAELELLRQHVVELAAQLEQTTRRAEYAEDCAEMWRDQVLNIEEDLMQETPRHRAIGLTKDGAVMVIDTRPVEACT